MPRGIALKMQLFAFVCSSFVQFFISCATHFMCNSFATYFIRALLFPVQSHSLNSSDDKSKLIRVTQSTLLRQLCFDKCSCVSTRKLLPQSVVEETFVIQILSSNHYFMMGKQNALTIHLEMQCNHIFNCTSFSITHSPTSTYCTNNNNTLSSSCSVRAPLLYTHIFYTTQFDFLSNFSFYFYYRQ